MPNTNQIVCFDRRDANIMLIKANNVIRNAMVMYFIGSGLWWPLEFTRRHQSNSTNAVHKLQNTLRLNVCTHSVDNQLWLII